MNNYCCKFQQILTNFEVSPIRGLTQQTNNKYCLIRELYKVRNVKSMETTPGSRPPPCRCGKTQPNKFKLQLPKKYD